MALTKIKGAGVNISATEKLYFDDGGNTYIYESGADVLDVYVGGANMVKLTESTTDTVTVTGDLTVGVDGTGHDVKFFGDTASAYMLWDQSADDLVLAGAAGIDLAGDIDVDGTANLDVVDIDGAVDMASTLTLAGNADFNGDLDVDGTTNLDAVDIDGAVQLDATLTIGADDQGYDVIFYGDTASSNMTWATSADDLILNDARLVIVQDDAEEAVFIDQNGNDKALHINTATTTSYGLVVQGDALTTGKIAYFYSNSSDTNTRNLVDIVNEHASSTGTKALSVRQDAAQVGLFIDQNANGRAIDIDAENTTEPTIGISSDVLTTGSIIYAYSNSSNNSTRNLLQITNDNTSADNTVGLLIQQDGADASIELTGNGSIKFPGTQGASSDANSLDDYEEGTWVGTFTDNTNDATMHATYRNGYYTKVGNIVHISGYFQCASLGSVSGNIFLQGLPFTCVNNSAGYAGIDVGQFGNGSITTGYSVSARTDANNTFLTLRLNDTTGGDSVLQSGELTADGEIIIGGSYRVA